MDTYRELVLDLFSNHSSKLIANSSEQHAAVLFEAIFKNAKKDIRIYSEKLSATVFNNSFLIDEARKFIENPDHKLLIAVTASHPDASDFLSLIRQPHNAKISVYRFPKIYSKGKSINFAVMDDFAYRFEPDSTNCRAIACANDPNFGQRLVAIYDSYLPVSKN